MDDEDDLDEGEEQHIEQSDHDSNSEQELEDEEDEAEDDLVNEGNFYLGKDNTTRWRKTVPAKNTRTRAHKIIKHLPGTKGDARQAMSPYECIKLYISDDIIRAITASTNIYIEKVKAGFQRYCDAKLTNEREISALIGILYLIASLRSSRKNLHKLWDNSKGNGVESCYLAFSENRFRFLLRCLRFDDIRNRLERKEIDKLAPITEIFEIFLQNFQKNFIPSEFLTIDEQLLSFRGRCPFIQFIPSKPAKYGVKMFALVDAKTSYALNLEPYVGIQPEGPYRMSNSPLDIVCRLVEPVQGTNRNITGDNWFSSIPLAKNLLDNKKLTYVGTLRKNKREIPPNFLPHKTRKEKSSIFGYTEEYTLVSYCPKKNKAVLLLSSMHHDDAIDPDTKEEQKPEIITFYNKTKIGVDLIDQLCENYNVARNTCQWSFFMIF
nr:unnamed protein product [Callosobruchus analis]